MKKIIALILVLVMSFALVACNFGGGDTTDDTNTPTGDTNNGGNGGGDENAPKPEKVRYEVPANGYEGDLRSVLAAS